MAARLNLVKGALQGPLSTWVEMECSLDLLQHLLLGFELQCYLLYDFLMIYWCVFRATSAGQV